jgi:putative membrane protein
VTGTALAFFSAFCFVAAVWREVRPKILNPVPHTQRLPAPLLLVMNGFLVLVSLAALGGIWVGRG